MEQRRLRREMQELFDNLEAFETVFANRVKTIVLNLQAERNQLRSENVRLENENGKFNVISSKNRIFSVL